MTKWGRTKPSMVLLEIPKIFAAVILRQKLTNLRIFLTQEVLSYLLLLLCLINNSTLKSENAYIIS